MVDKPGTYRSINAWEVLAAFFGYFAVARDVPDILRTLQIPKLLGLLPCVKNQLLEWNASPDFWLLLGFTLFTLFGAFYLLLRKEKDSSPKPLDKDEIIRKVTRQFRRDKIIRVVRSFGVLLIREFLLGLAGVEIYGTFVRPSTWPKQSTHFNFIDRIAFQAGNGFEYQYRRDFSSLTVRSHPEANDAYGPPDDSPPKWGDVKLLMIASNFFPFWYVVFWLKRPFTWCRNKFNKRL